MRTTISIALIGLITLSSGCIAPPLKFDDLKNAEELIVKKRNIHYKGQRLADYLSTFREKPVDFTIVHNAQKGKMKVNGYWYSIEYSEMKCADSPAIITILSEHEILSIQQGGE